MKKHFIATLILILVVLSCKKDERFTTTVSRTYLQTIQAALQDSMAQVRYAELDVAHSIIYRVDSVSLYLVRIPLKNKPIEEDFVLVQTSARGAVQRGKIIHQQGSERESGEGKVKVRTFNGSVSITSLDGHHRLTSPIKDGYIQALH